MDKEKKVTDSKDTKSIVYKKTEMQKFIKICFFGGLIIGAIWLIINLIIAIGPLWIIAIILLLLLFVAVIK